LVQNVIEVSVEGLRVRLPHPVAFALHKLIILGRRTKKEKAEKDLDQAVNLLRFVLKHEGTEKIKVIFKTMPKSWQKKIRTVLEKHNEAQILAALTGSKGGAS
jgi:hypothetical protein